MATRDDVRGHGYGAALVANGDVVGVDDRGKRVKASKSHLAGGSPAGKGKSFLDTRDRRYAFLQHLDIQAAEKARRKNKHLPIVQMIAKCTVVNNAAWMLPSMTVLIV